MPVQREIILSKGDWRAITGRFNTIAHDFLFSGPDAMYREWILFELMLASQGLGELITAEAICPDPLDRRNSQRLCLIAKLEYTGRIRVDDESRAAQEQVLLHVLDAPEGETPPIQIILPKPRISPRAL